MSVSGDVKMPPARQETGWLRRFGTNMASAWARLVRAPDKTAARPAWMSLTRVALGAVALAFVLAGVMLMFDAAAFNVARRLPRWIIDTFEFLTDFGTSGLFLMPIGSALLLIAAIVSHSMTHMSRAVLAAVAVRLGFLFVAIAVPGLFTTVVKRVIARARPYVGAEVDPFLYKLLAWQADHASLPSGHATTAFAAAVAVGLLWPRLRPLMWAYAFIIGLSRIVTTAHYPSDVIAGAVVGIVGALLVRHWFAVRRLGFVVCPDGTVKSLPGPSFARVKRVARGFATQ